MMILWTEMRLNVSFFLFHSLKLGKTCRFFLFLSFNTLCPFNTAHGARCVVICPTFQSSDIYERFFAAKRLQSVFCGHQFFTQHIHMVLRRPAIVAWIFFSVFFIIFFINCTWFVVFAVYEIVSNEVQLFRFFAFKIKNGKFTHISLKMGKETRELRLNL